MCFTKIFHYQNKLITEREPYFHVFNYLKLKKYIYFTQNYVSDSLSGVYRDLYYFQRKITN